MYKVSFIIIILMVGLALAFSRIGDKGKVEVPPMQKKVAVARHFDPPTINIPQMHLKTKIHKDVNYGPSWWSRTSRPGYGDTIAIAGHRTTHTHPFLDLNKLLPDDKIYITYRSKLYLYQVKGRRILSHLNYHIADTRGREILLLTACHPKHSAKQRIVIYARRVI